MRHLFTILLAMTILTLLTGLTEPWPQTDRKTWPVGGVAACALDFCDCPDAAAALLCQDFEDGASDCAVSEAFGSLNALGEIGYVGGAPGKINLYVGKTCVQYHIPAEEADQRLIDLIKEHGKWREPGPATPV